MTDPSRPLAVAVYCGSSPGKQNAYKHAAISLGTALARAQRQLVYGGGLKGIMGIVSSTALEAGGKVTGVIPYAMVVAGGEKQKTNIGAINGVQSMATEKASEQIETIVVNSMHERKIEMAKRVGGFVGLPGGYGTFEEVFEVTTWTQLGIHAKPVVLLNVLSFFNPLRDLIRNGVKEGFIAEANEQLVVFVDGPSDLAAHETFDWGDAAIRALDGWKQSNWPGFGYDWTKRMREDGQVEGDKLDAI